jgi:hypothetical protein
MAGFESLEVHFPPCIEQKVLRNSIEARFSELISDSSNSNTKADANQSSTSNLAISGLSRARINGHHHGNANCSSASCLNTGHTEGRSSTQGDAETCIAVVPKQQNSSQYSVDGCEVTRRRQDLAGIGKQFSESKYRCQEHASPNFQ